jgi:prepilin-type N-terminal cleavage/methylation domain-containing protein
MLTTLRRGARRSDAGLTLVELLVAMILLGVVGSLVTAAVVNASHALIHTEDENKGLQDAKVILDRMGRDVRQARGVVCDGAAADPQCTYHLQLWVDSNSDYVQQDAEIITWKLEQNGEHYDVWRVVGTGASAPRQRQASTLIVQTVFEYEQGVSIENSQIVKIDLTYDAKVGIGTKERNASFIARLRNKGIK